MNYNDPGKDAWGLAPPNGLEIFQVEGHHIRFGYDTERDAAYAVGPDFAKAMGHRDAADAARLLEDSEKGTQNVRTLGGLQEMTVFYEDGLWELIFRSSLPGAKAIKGRVKEILKQIRKTGSYSATPAIPTSFAEALQLAADQAREIEAQRAISAAQSAQLEIQAPMVDAYRSYLESATDKNISDVFGIISSKINERYGLKVKNKHVKLLRRTWFTFKAGTDQVTGSTAYARTNGYLTEEPGTYGNQVRFTTKGALRLAEIAEKHFKR
ncbi:BRO-N domain-containing protein [Actinoplanes derwentensis]|uniref:BRO family, N-terminal domain n=1 Tax=Actinoplanes derwentensis TaxID=113562 RepID=A0A1H1V1H1_9ACTN|nr:BRO family protein [Actinoplanes derwentensis]GID89828.1 hypothetical protein Ade03nite_87520 [Actinoplanes derwentensis]SDS78627.1 BRO family, N-terminal domain [Actinoplanes derwentensis]